MNKKIWYLKQIDLFRGFPKKKLKNIESLFRMKLYCKGRTVYGNYADDHVYIVKTGKVEVYTITADGQKFILDVLGKGSLFGNLTVGQSSETYVETLDDSYICFLDKTEFFSIVSKEPQVSQRLMQNLFEKLIATERKAASFALDNVLVRFVKLVLTLGQSSGENGHMTTDRFTHEQLAHMLGISRQTVTTLVNNLEREGRVKRDNKRIIFNRPTLEELVN